MIDLNDVALPCRPVRYDMDAIVARLRDTAANWVPLHFPNGRREGDEWRLADIRGRAPRKNGSCVIALKGPHAGDWYDHDGGDGGGPLNTLENATGLMGRDLYAIAAALVGWSSETPARREPEPAASRQEKDSRREIEFILSRAVPIMGTLGETYLRARGLKIPASQDLLYHPDLTHWETKTGFPALIGVVRDRAGEILALHRTYLRPDGSAKADVPKPKKMLGKVAGGAVRLGEIGADGILGLCEGIETGLSAMSACPGLPVWAALSTSHLEQAQLPPEAKEIVIFADNDSSGAGIRAAEATARRFRAEGRKVAIALPPEPDTDFNDLLLSDGPAAVVAAVQRAMQSDANANVAAETSGRHLPIGFQASSSPLPMLRADDGDLAHASDRAWNLLLDSNRQPWLFRAGGVPSWIVPDDDGRPMAVPITEERLRHMLAKLAIWRRLARNGDLVPAPPPTGLVKSLLATPDPALPVLAGIVNTPVFGKNGALITTPGYHPDARLLYHPTPGFALPSIPELPDVEDVAMARGMIIDDLFGDFPFVGDAERAHAIALLLLGFVRAMINGATPLHVIEKPQAGTGAGLMIDIVATIMTGSPVAVMTASDNDEEWRKRITAKLRQMSSMLVIDNINKEIDSAALAAALTAPFWEDRMLGVSEIIRIPIRCVWIATGNNPEFSHEITRRIVRIRLDAHVDQPWRRDRFKHPDLMGWVNANRARLVAACLTLVQAWIAAGKPMGVKRIGSFESWSRIIGGILEVAGIEGFLGNLDELMASNDAEGAMWRAFIAMWWDRFGTAEVGTGDLYEVALASEPPLSLGSGNERSQRIRLGKALGKMRDRVFDLGGRGVRITPSGVSHNVQRWRLSHHEGSPNAVPTPFRGDVGQKRGMLQTNIPLKNVKEINGWGDVGDVGDVLTNAFDIPRCPIG
jgi:phage/plasmid primase-like uncharacterized protein